MKETKGYKTKARRIIAMQDQFGFENNTEQIEQIKKEESGKKLRFAASKIGWATAALAAIWLALNYLIAYAFYLAGGLFPESSCVEFYTDNYLIFNELALAVAIALSMLILQAVPRTDVQREKISVGGFLKILVMCFGGGYIGNIIGTTILTFWNAFTGNSVGNEVAEAVTSTKPVILILCVAVMAPILEELFFRKFLVDRLRSFGELPAILLSAFLFALFHQSASQILYAFIIGVLLAYFYCRTGNYWLSVLIHGIFNMISGVLPGLYLPRVTEFLNEITELANVDISENTNIFTEYLIPLLEEYGLVLALFFLHTFVVFIINITGLVLLMVNFKKFKARKGEHSLSFEDSFNITFKTPGIFVCTIFLCIMTIISLFR